MRIRWRGVLSRHPRALAGLFAAYWLAMFLATHVKLPQVESAPKNTDKLVHLVMYAGFAFLLAAWRTARKPADRHLALWVFTAAMLYAAVDELLQIPLESRSADVWDFAMDLLGAMVGLLVFWAFRARCAGLWEPAPRPE